MSLLKFLFFCLTVVCTIQNSHSQKPAWAGVWGIWGENWSISNEQYPWYVGSVCHSIWKDIEPVNDEFDFTDLDNKIFMAAENDLYVTFKIYIAPDFAPEWLYEEAGVEKVISESGKVHPWYFDPDFKREFKEMIRAAAENISRYPDSIKEKVIGVQALIAKSGDPQPWNSNPVEKKYIIDTWWQNKDWEGYTREMYEFFYKVFQETNPGIQVIYKPMMNNENWVLENLPRSGRKTFTISQGYHLGNEQKYFFQREYISESSMLVRGEFDIAMRDNPEWFSVAPKWNVYWTSLWQLNYGVNIWNQREQMMENPDDYTDAFSFFTKYAGYEYPESSTGAWIAFRDDIDGADLERFPEEIYGSYDGGLNPERNLKIAHEFSEYGARQDDTATAFMEPGQVIHLQKGLNDVQSNVWRGNYSMFIQQIKANRTSQGYWRVGSKDQPYGRFARGFNHKEDKNIILLDLDDNFYRKDKKESGHQVFIKVTYFDSGKGKWELRYDAVNDENKSGLKVKNRNSNTWKTITLKVIDGYFKNRGIQGSDISLVNIDKKNNIFHMVEVVRQL